VTDHPIMECGCAAATNRVMSDGSTVPSCFTHNTIVVAQVQPDLSGRRARCDYFGKPTRKSECNYGNGRESVCSCEQPSGQLPFFIHKPTEPFDRFYCGCHGWD
jgi:hypothetical protein